MGLVGNRIISTVVKASTAIHMGQVPTASSNMVVQASTKELGLVEVINSSMLVVEASMKVQWTVAVCQVLLLGIVVVCQVTPGIVAVCQVTSTRVFKG